MIIDSIYPQAPSSVPRDLSKPTSQYKRHAWLALIGLLIFAVLYLGLTGWFCWSAYQQFQAYNGGTAVEGDLFDLLKSACCGLIAFFLIKGLFFKKSSGQSKDFEITREQQPRLFQFLDQVAAETNAPRPHKVFLSPDVNACVFYDLSILSFLVPSRKNLNIGLGLVNNLSLTEFKAVLAHEFGHFAQSTMAVGRWVYIAQQVAFQLIFHRDKFDDFLTGLSRFDLRIAWIGWLLRLVVWSIRSVLDTALSVVMLAERALSREMEFQADLVAVSSTGSDALIHALHRLTPADSAWSETQSFLNEELERGYSTADIFFIQHRIMEHHRVILDDVDFGKSPQLPISSPESNRVFTADLAQPPQMWATHPANHLREENAKKTYVPCELDSVSSWEIFDDPKSLRESLSRHILAEFKKPLRSIEESLLELDKTYAKQYYNPAYRGVYLERSVVSTADSVTSLYEPLPAVVTKSELYPEHLTDILEKHRNLAKEQALLTALRDRHFEPPGGVIRFRGEVIKRGDLGEAIETVDIDLKASEQTLGKHDRSCRLYHLSLAEEFGNGWPEYLKGCASILHFADHTFRNLADAHALLGNTLTVVLADGNVSDKERIRLLKDANDLFSVLSGIHQWKKQVKAGEKICQHFEGKAWQETFEKCELPAPNETNIGDWLGVIEGWTGEMLGALAKLRVASLETLLETEALLSQHHSEGARLGVAPSAPSPPPQYRILIPGKERSLQTKLNLWDSFQTASGLGPAIARFAIAALIIGGAIYVTLPDSSEELTESYYYR